MTMSERNRIFSGLAAEVAFAVLPLLVVLFVMIDMNRFPSIFESPEWSFGAAILFGQSLVKFVSGLARSGAAAIGPVALAVSLIVVFGLAPSLLVLTMTLLHSPEFSGHPGRWLQVLQVVLFCGGAVSYVLLGTVGEAWSKPS